jgi:hypothetical protein
LNARRRGRHPSRAASACGSIILLLATLCGVPAPAAAQWILQGRVLPDSLSTDPRLLTIRVYDDASALRATARPDSLGRFEAAVHLAGDVTLQLRIDMAEQPLHAVSIPGRNGDTTRVEVSLRGVLTLPAVTGSAKRSVLADRMKGFDERRRMGAGHFITRAQIDSRPGSTRVSDFIRGVPGVTLRPVSRSSGGMVAWTLANTSTLSSRTSCPMYMFVDGNPVHGAQGWDIDVIPTSQLQGIEIFRGVSEVPAVYAVQQAKCGVIALWTRRDHS